MSILDEILNSSDDDDDYEETEDENTEDSDDEGNLETDSSHEMSREEKEFLEAVQFAQQVERINQAIEKVNQKNGAQDDETEEDGDSDDDGNVIADTIDKAIDQTNKIMAERHSDSDRINYQQAPQPVDISSGNNNGNNLGAPNNYNIGNNAGYAQQQGFQSNAPQPNNTTPH